jgi:ATP-dependent DNA helicase RecG
MSKIEELIQGSHELAQKNCNSLIKDGLIEVSGREYMLTAKTYEAVKTAVDYTKDKSIQYIKAKEMILEYIRGNDSITNEKTRELCGFTKQQARMTIDKMRKENLIELRAAGKKSCYVLCK